MEPVSIPQLFHLPDGTLTLDFQGYLPDFETLTPIQGSLQVVHHGNYLAVTVEAQTIVTLTCNRCLGQYNARLAVATDELIWLAEPGDESSREGWGGLEDGGDADDLGETLDATGSFAVAQWLYEQVCLSLPSRQICAPDCQGIVLGADDRPHQTSTDQRWLALNTLRGQLSNNGL
ncbi:hypothetical protein PROH_20635 [Prochlorothrix hollandica PCC 9006 = CALU 1027]|uniref:Metal-binding protein n=1 Tax=Prochlorothrix hollandica PCC 9006 = CALU 1027 TaxID=317619 RepID=A0A0M2PNT3_PROHO|nr:hypothetical protein PROH_20635 [Prochlorothrix hollandica PCC 9006 = CALU 1027]